MNTELTKDQVIDLLKDFFMAYEKIVGAEHTVVFVQTLIGFAGENPDTVEKIQRLAAQNPDAFSDALTRDGVRGITEMIERFSAGQFPGF